MATARSPRCSVGPRLSAAGTRGAGARRPDRVYDAARSIAVAARSGADARGWQVIATAAVRTRSRSSARCLRSSGRRRRHGDDRLLDVLRPSRPSHPARAERGADRRGVGPGWAHGGHLAGRGVLAPTPLQGKLDPHKPIQVAGLGLKGLDHRFGQNTGRGASALAPTLERHGH